MGITSYSNSKKMLQVKKPSLGKYYYSYSSECQELERQNSQGPAPESI